ncbi:M16 family metallopeptidase [Thiomicrospira cyclica]|uniref:Peptidase M16 domain protein n=1 Tax=Thiomicrospira cyclica (strain DSM 14477 / JCM 11371 / ALM1) TaxID=717773 RepID=F6DA09_THICA|nr:pitrilysin family protein [Thiomicrospira cyclica]AEG31046.1 peptidase M16 domain protein [Thiomicrospira cyclica ALM1]
MNNLQRLNPLKRLKNLIAASASALMLSLSQPVLAQLDIQTWQTQEGAKVLFVATPELPMMDIELLFDAGSARDGAQPGLANFTGNMIGLATSQRNEQAIADGFNDLGAVFNSNVNRDMTRFSLRSLTREPLLTAALDLFTEVIADAEFPADIMQRDRVRLLQAMQQADEVAGQYARKVFWQRLYQDHPYGQDVAGDSEVIEQLTPMDLDAFYRQYYVAQNAQISIVGDLSQSQAKAIAQAISERLASGVKATAIPTPEPVTPGLEVVEFTANQTQYFAGQLGVERGHPDYYALFLGNHLLGGSGFASLLVEEVREKRGLVYSVFSFFAPMREAGPWMIGLSTANNQAQEADQVVKETLLGFLEDFDDAKFADIKQNLLGGWPMRFDTNDKILGYLTMIGFYDLPLDYLEAFPAAIEALEKADVLAAWRQHIHPDNLFTLMVGQPVLDATP